LLGVVVAVLALGYRAGDQRIRRWEEAKAVLRQQIVSLTVDNGRLRAENQNWEIQNDGLKVVTERQAVEIRHVAAMTAAVPVPDTCKKVVALRDSSITLLTKQVGDYQTQLTNEKIIAANLSVIDTNTAKVLTSADSVVTAAPIRPSFLQSVLPHITVGVGPAWTLDDSKLHLLAVNMALSWKIR
jgi:hypothetical protein